MEDELVQYFIVNSELNMSAGKIAAQVAHVASDMAIHMTELNYMSDTEFEETHIDWDDIVESKSRCEGFQIWHNHNQPKIILRGKQKEMEELIKKGWYFIRDNGRTEIPADSLTVVGFTPEYKSIMKPIVKRFQLL